MRHRAFGGCALALATVVVAGLSQHTVAQSGDPPNPYRAVENWVKLPDGRKWGQTISIDVDADGKSLWVFERCGGTTCDGSDVAPILKVDPSGNVIKAFGAGMFVFPRGLHVDRDGKVTALIPDPEPAKEGSGPGNGSAAEGVAADAEGNVYGAEVDARKFMRYVRK